ncbi:hypothetical protein V1477_006399 [Vespula maculifrons]|uniref:Uncharacterized protein n=1 Tax=Vespula maculifrons TaxID=7453 RepID=A0ABD2CK87_VESMC
MFVEGATSPFQIPCSGSRTCYSFGEKNSRLLLVRSVHKNMRVECATSPFKRPRSGSPRCYSFGEKNS